jgi:hypothetical protein
MSTATAEAPKTETLPPAGDAPTPKQKEAFLDIFRAGKKAAPKEAVVTDKVVTEAPKETKEIVKEVTKVEEKKPEAVKEDKPDNFAALRQKAEAAEKAAAEAAAERDRLRAEYEEYKKKPAPKEVMDELEMTKKEKAEYQKRLREADLARDPEFNARFDNPIRASMEQMVNIAVAAGVERKDAAAVVSAWDKGQFREWLSTMDDLQKTEFGAAMQNAVMLYNQKETELANAEQTWKERVKQQEEQQKTQREQYLSGLSADIEANLKELAETPLGKDHTELLTETRTLLRRAGGLEGERIDNKTLLGMVGKSLLLAKGFERQEKVLAEKTQKIAELEKTLAERDAFIKEQSSATPSVNGSLSTTKTSAKAAAQAILNPVIN